MILGIFRALEQLEVSSDYAVKSLQYEVTSLKSIVQRLGYRPGFTEEDGARSSGGYQKRFLEKSSRLWSFQFDSNWLNSFFHHFRSRPLVVGSQQLAFCIFLQHLLAYQSISLHLKISEKLLIAMLTTSSHYSDQLSRRLAIVTSNPPTFLPNEILNLSTSPSAPHPAEKAKKFVKSPEKL